MSLLNPRALAVGPDGRRYIADTDNHRVVVLGPNGEFVSAFGSYCQLGEGEAGGCVDPDGSGPGELGDGQFYEPWGIAVDADGTIYVADTWNGRIQALDSDGKSAAQMGLLQLDQRRIGRCLRTLWPAWTGRRRGGQSAGR